MILKLLHIIDWLIKNFLGKQKRNLVPKLCKEILNRRKPGNHQIRMSSKILVTKSLGLKIRKKLKNKKRKLSAWLLRGT